MLDSDLGSIAGHVAKTWLSSKPRSSQQEGLENYVNCFV